jgi:hypothetical protein
VDRSQLCHSGETLIGSKVDLELMAHKLSLRETESTILG